MKYFKSITVGELKKYLKLFMDDTPLVMSDADHSYCGVYLHTDTALFDPKNGLTEDYGEDKEDLNGKRMSVLVVTKQSK